MAQRTRGGIPFLVGFLCLLGLANCAADAPPGDQTVIVISGQVTAGYSASEAAHRALHQAALTAVDRGFRYFEIADANRQAETVGSTNYLFPDAGLPMVAPGKDVTIRLFHDGEISANTAGVYDAQKIFSRAISALRTPRQARRPLRATRQARRRRFLR